MELLIITCLGLGVATYYFTTIILYTDGPFDVFKKVRDYANASIDDPDQCETGICKVLSCYWCLSMWVSFLISAAYCVAFYAQLAYHVDSVILFLFVLTLINAGVANLLNR